MFPADVGEPHDSKFVKTQIAGLQYYEYEEADEINGRIRPVPGERLQLIRCPDNGYDPNAVEVWFHNGQYMLGHVPRCLAAALAPILDGGKSLRAYAINGGDGRAWSVDMLIVGDSIPDEEYDRCLLMEARSKVESVEEAKQRERAAWNQEGFDLHRQQRRMDAAAALALLLAQSPPVHKAPTAPQKGLQGRVFDWWDEIPSTEAGPVLRTRTQWSEAGFKVKARCKAFAAIEYGQGRRYRRYELYGAHQIQPKKQQTAKQIAAKLIRDIV